jgi:hypothetical protein
MKRQLDSPNLLFEDGDAVVKLRLVEEQRSRVQEHAPAALQKEFQLAGLEGVRNVG